MNLVINKWIVLGFLLFFLFYFKILNKKYLIEHYSGQLRVANEIDKKRATKYALKTLCTNGGYKWIQGPEDFTYDCKHTKDTCIRESVYPTLPEKENKYYEWRDKFSDEHIKYVNFDTALELSTNLSGGSKSEPLTDPDGICIVGNEAFRKFCEDESLNYNINNGNCYTTKKYCDKNLLAWCQNDCYQPPVTEIISKVLGTTLARAGGMVERTFTNLSCPN